MFGPKLRRPDQPLWIRSALGLFEFASSLKLAVTLIFSCALALGWATFVESAYGTPAVQFGVYGTWWFALLNLLLAVNIFCAAAIRYPWKRHQTGFVITHIGLLVLLFGCLIQRQRGIDAQMPIFEGQIGHRAFEDAHHFQLVIDSKHSAGKPRVVEVPFAAGPFNWQDYSGRLSRPMNAVEHEGSLMRGVARAFAHLNGAVFRLASRDQGLIYDRDGVQLAVLDYYSDSVEVEAPMVKLRMTSPRGTRLDADNRSVEGPQQWVPVELNVTSDRRLPNKLGLGGEQRVGGGSLVFTLASGAKEVDAFLKSAPEGSLGEKGQVVLYVNGERVRVPIDEKLGAGRFPLGKSGIEAEIASYWPTATVKPNPKTNALEWIADTANDKAENPTVQIKLFRGEESLGGLTLFADHPKYSLQDYDNQIFGSYWFDHGEKTATELMQGGGGSRIDILQGPVAKDGTAKLYYRYWNRKQVVAAAELPQDGKPVDAFKMPIAQLKMVVDQLVPAEKPERKILPLAFDPKKMGKLPAAQVRLTVDGKSEEFLLAGIPGSPEERPLLRAEKREVASDRRQVTITMPPDEIDIGFGVRLQDFERKLDPGTSQASHFSSVVDFLDLDRGKTLHEDVFITMNAPVDFSDPKSGRSYRLFQESFFGPIRPGSAEFDKYFAASGLNEGYMSTLTVNYDPGRAVKYSGCLFIVAGIATMFYMRAYFFKPTAKPPSLSAAAAKPKRKREPVGSGR